MSIENLACLQRDWRQAALWFAEDFAPEVLERVRAFIDEYEERMDALFADSAVVRLKWSRQYGIKSLSARRGVAVPRVSFSEDKEWCTRFHHSSYAAALGIVTAAKMCWEPDEIALQAVVGALHDIGHGPFAHDIDSALTELDLPNHEERGEQILLRSERLARKIRAFGLEPHEVIHGIREEYFSRAGILQRFVDTLAYLVVDQIVCNFLGYCPEEEYRRLATDAIHSLFDVEPEDGIATVQWVEQIQAMVDRRTELHRDMYSSVSSRVPVAALKRLVVDAFRLGWLDAGAITGMRTAWVYDELRAMVVAERERHAWHGELWELMHAEDPFSCAGWKVERVASACVPALLASMPTVKAGATVVVGPAERSRLEKEYEVLLLGDHTTTVVRPSQGILTEGDLRDEATLFVPTFL